MVKSLVAVSKISVIQFGLRGVIRIRKRMMRSKRMTKMLMMLKLMSKRMMMTKMMRMMMRKHMKSLIGSIEEVIRPGRVIIHVNHQWPSPLLSS